MSDLAKHFAPLTGAEAELAMRYMAQSGCTEAEAVAQVKSERVGPAATWDQDYAATQAAALAEEPADPPADTPSEADEPDDDDLPLTLNDEDDVPETPTEDMWDEDQIRDAGAYELASYVKAHPDLADLIAPIENDREGGPRKTVLDALDSVKEEQ